MQDEIEIQKRKLQKATADVIKELRLSQDKSISCISAEVLMAKSIWSKIEKGEKDPQYSTLWKISEALDITIDQLSYKIRNKLGNKFSLSDLD